MSANEITRKLIRLEDSLNNRKENKKFLCYRPGDPDLDKIFHDRMGNETFVEFLIKELPKRGFKDKNGLPDYVAFYKYSWISSYTWHMLISGKSKPGYKTIRRIIIGLKLNEDDANWLISLVGQGFNPADPADNLFLACIECGYNTPGEVNEIFDYYAGMYPDGKKRFPNPYEDRTSESDKE